VLNPFDPVSGLNIFSIPASR